MKIFSQVSQVSTAGGVHPSWSDTHPLARQPPWPDTPRRQTPRWPHPHGQTPTSGQTPPPRQTATAADGPHPTGIHSCLNINLVSYIWKFWSISIYKETELISILKIIFAMPNSRTDSRTSRSQWKVGHMDHCWFYEYFMRSWTLTLFAVGSPVACGTDARESPDVISLTSRSVTALVLLVNVTSWNIKAP